MKKLISFLLAMLVIIAFCACARTAEDTESDTKGTDHSEAGEEKPGGSLSDPSLYDENFELTICTSVAEGITIVGGTCSSECEYVAVTGGREDAKIYPDYNNEGGYFIGQVKTEEDCTLSVTEMKEGNAVSQTLTKKTLYRIMDNLMESDDYMPVFGGNSRMHFYSSVLAYSLSDVIDDEIKSAAGKIIKENVANAKAANADTEIVYLIVPSSSSVYPETVPEEYPAAQGETVFDAFKEIAGESGAKVIYPLDLFKEHKDDGKGYKIYHNTDSHWTTYGAYLGLGALCDYVSEKYPAAKARTLDEMGFYTEQLWGGDALFSFGDNGGFENYSATGRSGETAKTKINELTTLYQLNMPTNTLKNVYRGMKSIYVDGGNSDAATVKNPSGDGLPTALVIRDSFGCTVYDMFNDRFSTVWWQGSHNYEFPAKAVMQNKPDYVVYIVSERNIFKLMLENSNASICLLGE